MLIGTASVAGGMMPMCAMSSPSGFRVPLGVHAAPPGLTSGPQGSSQWRDRVGFSPTSGRCRVRRLTLQTARAPVAMSTRLVADRVGTGSPAAPRRRPESGRPGRRRSTTTSATRLRGAIGTVVAGWHAPERAARDTATAIGLETEEAPPLAAWWGPDAGEPLDAAARPDRHLAGRSRRRSGVRWSSRRRRSCGRSSSTPSARRRPCSGGSTSPCCRSAS